MMQRAGICTNSQPSWIVFRAGRHQARLPFREVIDPADDGWAYILDITSIGFRADRVGDCIVITGRPNNDNREVPAS